MDFKRLLTVGGTLAGLGFITTCLASLLVCFSISTRICGIIVGIILCVAAALYIFLGWKTDAENHSRGVKFFAAIVSIIGGVVFILLPLQFHVQASYLNRMVLYVLALAGVSVDLALQWPFITSFVFQDALDAAHLGSGKEHVLYTVFNTFTAFIAATLIPIASNSNNDALCGSGIIYSIAGWFVAAIVFFLVGIKIIGTKSSNISASVYDKVAE